MTNFNTPRNASEAAALIRVEERAARITEDYRLSWSRYDKCFYVTHKEDRARRYRVTSTSCSCPFNQQKGTCKHVKGLAALCDVEIARYKLLKQPESVDRFLGLLTEIEELKWQDEDFMNFMVQMYGNNEL